jgi:signal transduction histidine kinase/CheY-like chemotaxis protein/HPt (histidine-containing phosphotransfer) domain-containing protein
VIKSKIDRQDQPVIVIIIAILTGVVFFFLFDQVKNDKISQYKNQCVSELRVHYNTIINTYKLVSETVLEEAINKPGVLVSMAKALHADKENRAKYRKELFDKLTPTYERLKKRNVRQLHFQFPDGTSFLRFHRPEKFGDNLTDIRDSIKIANRDKSVQIGFEEGRIKNGFRYVFPLSYKNEHIGAVETSVSFNTISALLKEIHHGKYHLLISKDILKQKVFRDETSKYVPTVFTSQYVYEANMVKKISAHSIKLNWLMIGKVEKRLAKREGFAIPLSKEGVNSLVSFLPVKNLKGNHAAFIVSYKTDDTIARFERSFLHQTLTAELFLLFMTLFAIRERHSQKKLRQAKDALEKNNRELENHRLKLEKEIDERIETEEALQRSKTAAEAANVAKSEFLANMSHEIRTPLNGVIGMLNLLENLRLGAEEKDYVETAMTSAEALLSIINDILDFSKIEAGMLEIETKPFNLEHELNRCVRVFSSKIEAKGVELITGFDANMPKVVVGDIVRLRQVLDNLLSNALKFTSKGHVWVNVKCLRADEKTARIQFSVQDTGIGIPREKQGRIFDHFTQADTSTTRNFGGTGLGLAICRQLVELMGGALALESIEEKGSTFHFTLILAVGKQTPVKKVDPAPLNENRILVVDDNEINLRIFSEYLSAWDIRHETCLSAREALNALQKAQQKQDPFHIMVADFLMPEINGEQLGRIVKSDDALKETIMIMISSAGMQSLDQIEKIGFAASLPKPIGMSDFLNVLLMALDRNGGPFITPVSLRSADEDNQLKLHDNIDASGLRILLVEDNKVNQKAASAILKIIGFKDIAIAENGQEAFALIRKTPYDLVFMDVQMPVMNGYKATEKIRQWERERSAKIRMPIIAMTANAIAGDREKCLAAGMDDYISKPIRKITLINILKRWTARIKKKAGHRQRDQQADNKIKDSRSMIFNYKGALSRYEGDKEVLKMIVEEFIGQTPGILDEIESFIKVEDVSSAGSKAHALKGGASYIGAEHLMEAALGMEKAGKSENMIKAKSLFAKLQFEFETFDETIKGYDWD